MLEKCRIILDGGTTQQVWIVSPSKGLFIDGLVWRETHDFSEGRALLILASEYYDVTNYTRD